MAQKRKYVKRLIAEDLKSKFQENELRLNPQSKVRNIISTIEKLLFKDNKNLVKVFCPTFMIGKQIAAINVIRRKYLQSEKPLYFYNSIRKYAIKYQYLPKEIGLDIVEDEDVFYTLQCTIVQDIKKCSENEIKEFGYLDDNSSNTKQENQENQEKRDNQEFHEIKGRRKYNQNYNDNFIPRQNDNRPQNRVREQKKTRDTDFDNQPYNQHRQYQKDDRDNYRYRNYENRDRNQQRRGYRGNNNRYQGDYQGYRNDYQNQRSNFQNYYKDDERRPANQYDTRKYNDQNQRKYDKSYDQEKEKSYDNQHSSRNNQTQEQERDRRERGGQSIRRGGNQK